MGIEYCEFTKHSNMHSDWDSNLGPKPSFQLNLNDDGLDSLATPAGIFNYLINNYFSVCKTNAVLIQFVVS